MSDVYGVELFEEMVNILWENRENLLVSENYIDFGYPEYGGLPKRIYRKLSSDAVRQIQYAVGFYEPNKTNKREFRKLLRDHLFILSS